MHAMTQPVPYPIPQLASLVDVPSIRAYSDMLFGDVDEDFIVALREIGEPGTPQAGKVMRNFFVDPANGALAQAIIDRAVYNAQRHIATFITPALIRREAWHGKVGDDAIMGFTTACIDIDKGNTLSVLAWAESAIGPATMVVHSGGMTDEGNPKLHAYWRLSEPVFEPSKIAVLRKELALKLGADASFGRMAQVIRVPGSTHAKNGNARPVTIRSKSNTFYEMDDVFDAVLSMQNAPGVAYVAPSRKKPSVELRTASDGTTYMDFSADIESWWKDKPSVASALTTDIHAGGDTTTRYSEFTRVAGAHIAWARTGVMSEDDAFAALVTWCDAHMKPVWEHERIVQEWNALVRLDKERHPTAAQAAPMELRNTGGLATWDIGCWAEGPPPKRRHLVQGLVMAGVPNVLVADSGVGKTFLCLDLGLRLAGHTADIQYQWLGEPLTAEAEGGVVVLLAAEDDKDELHIRLSEIDPHGDMRQAARGRFRVVPLPSAGGAFQMLQRSIDGNVTRTPQWQAMVTALQEIRATQKISLVMVDTLATHLHGEDTRNDVITQFFSELNKVVCGEIGAALLLTHHVRKGDVNNPINSGEDMSAALRGGTAIKGSARNIIGVWHANDFGRRMRGLKLKPEKGMCFRLEIIKANNPEMLKGTKTLIRQPCGLLQDRTADDKLAHGPSGEHAAWIVFAVKTAAMRHAPFSKAGANDMYHRRGNLPPALHDLGKIEMARMVEALLGNGDLVQARLAAQKTGAPTHLDVPGGPVARGEGSNDPGAWVPDWSGYAYDSTLKAIVEA
jgi:hypothetical protein